MRPRVLPVLLALALLAGACTSQRVAPAAPAPAAPRQDAAPTGSNGTNRPEHHGKPHVVLVSFDGFRADYFEMYGPPNFQRAINRGIRAEALIPVFPSKTFPNHYSIVTGLYPEHHGIVGNAFYDPARDASYAFWEPAVTDGSWYRGEPIWVTAEKQGMVSACFFWPGSEASIQGLRPTYYHRYDGDVPNDTRVDAVLEWLRLPDASRPRVITLYFSDVDTAGHRYGPSSQETREAVMTVDAALGRLMDGIDALPIRDQIYLLLVSDHGMAETGAPWVTPLEGLIDLQGITVPDAGPAANLHVPGDAAHVRRVRDQLNAGLQHGRAYLRPEVPERLHYRADPRIGDVVIVMEAPYMVSVRRPGREDSTPPVGMHGWDPAVVSMHGIFVATGPGLKQASSVPAFVNVDVYPFMAEVLGLSLPERLDGARGRLRQLAAR
jgi:predicted AlkP superfamily pyrophosphatase or phosphodiesterase